MKKILILLVVVASVALPAEAGATQLKGVVVGKQEASRTLVVAGPNGIAWTVHTSSPARVGALVTMAATRTRNGTWAANSVRVSGRTSHARIRGVVVRRTGGATFLAAGHSVLTVRSKSRSLSSTASSGPQPGTVADVGLLISASGSLTQTSITPLGHSGQIAVLASVTAVLAPTVTTAGSITLSVNGQPLVIPLAAGTTVPPGVVVGGTVMMTIRFTPTGPMGGAREDDEDDTAGTDDTDETDDDDMGDDDKEDEGDD